AQGQGTSNQGQSNNTPGQLTPSPGSAMLPLPTLSNRAPTGRRMQTHLNNANNINWQHKGPTAMMQGPSASSIAQAMAHGLNGQSQAKSPLSDIPFTTGPGSAAQDLMGNGVYVEGPGPVQRDVSQDVAFASLVQNTSSELSDADKQMVKAVEEI